MRTTFADKPITNVREAYHVLCLYYDLDEEAKNRVFRTYDNEDDARFYLDGEYEEMFEAARWFMDRTISGCLDYDDYSGRWFVSSTVSTVNGRTSCYREFVRIEDWSMCYELDALEAWNRHVSRLQYLYRRVESMGCGFEAPGTYAMPLEWYELRYEEELENALSDVCSALNKAIDGAEAYTLTREFFEDQLDRDDSEHWYTLDGGREFVRDASWFMCTDTCHDVDVIFENREPARLYVREYLD